MAEEKVKHDLPDVRYEAPLKNRPFSSIVKVIAYRSNAKESTRGTGFLVAISSRLVIVTAGHCLKEASFVEIFWPNQMGNKINPDRFQWNERPDYGIILLHDKEIPDEVKSHLTVLVPHYSEAEENHSILISGYPKEVHCDTKFINTNANGQYVVCLSDPKRHPERPYLLYLDPTSGGMSGGPVFYKCGQNNFAFGIHIRGFVDEKGQEAFCNEAELENPPDQNVSLSGGEKQHGIQPEEDNDLLMKRHNVALLLTEDIIGRMRHMVKEMQLQAGADLEKAGDNGCARCIEMKKMVNLMKALYASNANTDTATADSKGAPN